MHAFWRISASVLISLVAVWTFSESLADPATPSSKRVAQYGNWSVVKKPNDYIIVDDAGQPVKRGRHMICSVALFASNASLELQATNKDAWSIYIAAENWNYRYGLKALSISSASQELRLQKAVYHGSMISAASHYLGGGKPVPMKKLKSLVAKGQPISIHDHRGRKLVTFPNTGSDLSKALDQAIKCTLSNVSLPKG